MSKADEKEHLRLYGRPIVNDEFYALKAGPAPSLMYNMCKIAEGGDHYVPEEDRQSLKDVIPSIKITSKSTKNSIVKSVHALEKPDLDELSTSDIECIDLIYSKYAKLRSSKLSDISHDIAWEKNWDPETESSSKMRLLDIAKAGDVDHNMLQYINENLALLGIKM
jgi:uncharacterized phage-associated protein